MAVRQKQKVLDIAHAHFKDFGLPLDIDYKSYTAIVGPEAVDAISIKRSFKAWKYVLHALKVKHPELMEAPKPAPKPAPRPKAPSKPAPKAAPKSDD